MNQTIPPSTVFIALLVLSSLFGCEPNKDSETTRRPNILFLLSDDHTSQAWGIYGGVLEGFVKNNNIERIASEGAVLQNVFATNAICTASRAAILTGQYSHQNGIYRFSDPLPPDSDNIAKVFQQAGYQTAVIGKWHLIKQPSGFDHFMVLPGQGYYRNPKFKTAANWQDGGKGGKVYQGFSTDIIGDLSLEWLKNRNKDQPFLLMTHFKATHEPFDYPARHKELNANVEIPEPHSLLDFGPKESGRTFVGQQLKILGQRYVDASKKMDEIQWYPGLPFSLEGLGSIQAQKKIYQKMVKDFIRSGAAIDDNIGKLLDHLETTGELDNTIVIYTSDQGYFLGEHGFMDKRMMYEESMRMPFIIRYPKEIRAGTVNDDLILNIDFAALFADYAEILPVNFVSGRSFRENLKGNTSDDWRQKIYYRYWHHQTHRPAHLGIRTARYKLIFFYGKEKDKSRAMSITTPDVWEFYDLQKDPKEQHNAYLDPEYQELILSLKRGLIELKHDVGDRG
jgi:arylsulfatase A-like enzyme